MVTVGSQQALDLLTRIFIDPGDVILVEAPSYVGALGAFAAYQANVVHVPMDDDGLHELLRVATDPDDGWVSDQPEVMTFARLALAANEAMRRDCPLLLVGQAG